MEPVLIVVDANGVFIHAGHPAGFKKKLQVEYVRTGCTIKTITIDEYRNKNYTLYQKAPRV